MLKNFFSRFIKTEFPKNVRRWILPEADAQRWEMPDPQVYGNQANLYRKLSYIGTVVDVVSAACTDSDFDIMGADEKEIDNHPFELLLDRPNEYDSRTEFMRAHFSWRVISGNSYWFLNRTSAKVAPDELWIIPPSKIIPVPDGKLGLRGYLYYPGNGQEIPLEPYEIIHFKSFNPFNRYLGLSAIESLAMVSEGATAAQEWNTRLFAENNARLPGILAFAEMINDSDWEKMKKDITRSAEKRNNMMLRGVGKGGVEWMQGTATQKEMEFLEGLDRSMREIYDRLAPGLYNMLTSNSSLANGQTGMAAFARYTLSPLLRETADKITSDILPAYGANLTAEYEDVVPEDKDLKFREIELFSQFHTVDEVRVEMFGNNPIGDQRGALLASQVSSAPAPQEVPQEQPAPMVELPQPVEDIPAEIKADINRWKRKAIRAFGNIDEMTLFTDSKIPADIHSGIVQGLKSAASVNDVARVFDSVKQVKETDSIRELARVIEMAMNG